MKKLLIVFLLVFTCLAVFGQRGRVRVNSGDQLRYDFANKRLLVGADSSAGSRPLLFPGDDDVQITVFNYNPLRYSILSDDTAFNRFMTDAQRFAALTTPSTPVTSPLSSNQAENSLFDPVCSIDSSIFALHLAVVKGIGNYYEFLRRVENIEGHYNTLRIPEALTTALVQAELTPYIAQINNHITAVNGMDLGMAAPIPNLAPNVPPASDIVSVEIALRGYVQAKINHLAQVKAQLEALNTTTCAAAYRSQNNEYEKVLALATKFQNNYDSDISVKLPKLMVLYSQLRVYASAIPDVVTPAVTVDKDVTVIRFYQVEGQSSKKYHDKITMAPYGGIKVDFSAGMFVSGLYDEMYNRNTKDTFANRRYLKDGQVRDTTVAETWTRFVPQEQSKLSYGVMLYSHFYWRTGRTWAAGLHVGVGALFNNQARWVGATGLSILLGRSQRLSINPSVAFAQVDRLTAPYKADQWEPRSIDNVPLTKVWKTSWALGLSWNF